MVILAVKPQIMTAGAARDRAPPSGRQHLLISIAAGVSTAHDPRAALGKEARIIRVMPNTPALVLQGATAIAKGKGLGPDDLGTAEEIFGAVGRVVVLDEELMDAVTGLSGSGPAYVAIVIESLADGGVKMGLDRATAMTLATQTVLGAAQLLAETGLHPGALKDMVSSPGWHHDRRHLGARGGRHPHDIHPCGGAGHPAVARAGPGPGLMFVVSHFILAIARLLELAPGRTSGSSSRARCSPG